MLKIAFPAHRPFYTKEDDLTHRIKGQPEKPLLFLFILVLYIPTRHHNRKLNPQLTSVRELRIQLSE